MFFPHPLQSSAPRPAARDRMPFKPRGPRQAMGRKRSGLASVRGSVRGPNKTGVKVERTLRQRFARSLSAEGPFEVTLVVGAVPKYHSVRAQNPNSGRWNAKPKGGPNGVNSQHWSLRFP